jgi:hypothetical protein
MELNKEQKDWLFAHGGRNAEDVLKDDKGMFVLMRNGRQDVKVYLPKD